MTGFIGTYLCGARIGLFNKDGQINYILCKENFIEHQDEANSDEHSDDNHMNTKDLASVLDFNASTLKFYINNYGSE